MRPLSSAPGRRARLKPPSSAAPRVDAASGASALAWMSTKSIMSARAEPAEEAAPSGRYSPLQGLLVNAGGPRGAFMSDSGEELAVPSFSKPKVVAATPSGVYCWGYGFQTGIPHSNALLLMALFVCSPILPLTFIHTHTHSGETNEHNAVWSRGASRWACPSIFVCLCVEMTPLPALQPAPRTPSSLPALAICSRGATTRSVAPLVCVCEFV